MSHPQSSTETDVPKASLLADAMPVLVSYIDAEQTYRFVNAAFLQWFDTTSEQIVGQTMRDFIGEKRYNAIREHVKLALDGYQVTFETEIKTHDKQVHYSHVIFVPQVGADRNVVGFYSIVTDISELKRSTEALRDSEAIYHSLVESMPLCILRKDVEGHFTYTNSMFLEMSGNKLDDILGKTDFDLFPQELAEKYRADDRQVLESQKPMEAIERHQAADGLMRFVQILKTPVYDAQRKAVGTQVLFWDVTDRENAEAAVQEAATRKRAIFDSALDCIVIANQDGSIVDFNRAAERTFGKRREEVLGQNMDQTLFPPQLGQRSKQNRDSYDNSNESGSLLGKRVEVEAVRSNGEPFHCEMAMQAIPLEGKTVFAVFLHDITDRKNAEAEIAQKNKDLETLLHVTSHDLREPLRSIESFSKLLDDRYRDSLDEQGRDFLNRVVEGAQRLDRLLEDVLMLSRAKKVGDSVEFVESEKLVSDVIKQLDRRISETSAKINVCDDLPMFYIDRRWVRQAVFNLVANALKFTKDDEPPEIEIAAYEPIDDTEPAQIGLEIRDRGPGIAAEHQERVFQMFQRAVGRRIEGTGAGLAIVQEVAKRHDGNAWVRAREGGGSVFVISFPAEE